MTSKDLTKREVLLRQRAARVQERALPDQIRRAYGQVPIELADLPDDDPQLATLRESARAALIARGHLRQEELDTLPVDEAIGVALQRLRGEAASLREQAALLANQDKGNSDVFTKAPRTLRQR